MQSATQTQANRFWVLGGEFASMAFERMVAGTERLVGPLASRQEAERIWRRLSEETRHRGTVRYAIVAEPAG